MIPRSVRHRLAPRPRSRMIQSRYPWKHRRYFTAPTPPLLYGWHEWQEYNAHGNTCHYPGCRMTEDQHPRLVA